VFAEIACAAAPEISGRLAPGLVVGLVVRASVVVALVALAG
jgi:hypothetical protein